MKTENKAQQSTTTDRDSYQRNIADEIAFFAHLGQFRRDGISHYYQHCKRVADRLTGDRLKAVGFLHDVLEDTALAVNDLREREVSEDIIEAVKAMTKREGEDYTEYLNRVKSNDMACKVKIADMIDNLSDDPTEKQIVKYAKGLLALTASPKTEKD